MKKLFRWLHLWPSLILGGIISFICFTGAILVFQQEFTRMSHPDRYYVSEVGGERLSIPEIEQVVYDTDTTLLVTDIELSHDPRRTVVVMDDSGRQHFVNPYTGEVIDSVMRRSGFFTTVMRLHRWFNLPDRAVGKNIVGYTTLVLLLIIISGLIVWIPKNRKQLKSQLKVRTSPRNRFWYDLHVSLGFYVALGLLVLAATGLTYSFSWYRTGFYKMLGLDFPSGRGGGQGGGHGHQHGKEQAQAEEQPPIDYTVWQRAVEEVQSRLEKPRTMVVSAGRVSVLPASEWGNSRARDNYQFDETSGEIVQEEHYADQPTVNKVRGWIFTLHTGTWGGLVGKIVTFLVAVIAGTLPLTGYYLYFRKKIKKWSNKKKLK